VGKSSKNNKTSGSKRKQKWLARPFMSEGPLRPSDTVIEGLFSARKFTTYEETMAYYVGVYDLLLMLWVVMDDYSPSRISQLLDGLVDDCEKVIPPSFLEGLESTPDRDAPLVGRRRPDNKRGPRKTS